ncbi:MAG: PKD domain-containing protein [Thermoplasmata archaeon]|nr:PKD domain-containing protein [Candidatus Sysuiplasma jiujiangense]
MSRKQILAIFFAIMMIASGIGMLAIQSLTVGHGTQIQYLADSTTSGGTSYVDEGQGITYSYSTSFNVVSEPLTVSATLTVNGYTSTQSTTYTTTGDKSKTWNFGYTWSSTSGSASGTSYGWSITTTDSYGGNVGGDSGTTIVYTDPSVSVSSSLNPADSGQAFTLAASVSGGTSPYTYQWYTGSSGSGTAISGATSSTYSTSESPSSATSYNFYVSITDSVGEIATSSTFTQNINAPLVLAVSSNLNPSDTGQIVDFSTATSGGTGSYSSYSYVLYDGTSTSDAQLASGSTSSFSYIFSTAGSFLLDYSVTDTNGYTYSTSITQIVYPDPQAAVINAMTPGVFYVYSYTSGPTEGAVPYSDISSYPLSMPDSSPNNVSTWTGTFNDGGFGYDYGNPGYNGQTFLGRPNVAYPSSLGVLNTEPGGRAYDEGYMAVTVLYFAAGTYTFNGEYDDNGAMFISSNGVDWTSIIGSSAWVSEGATAYSGTETLSAGWYFFAVDNGNMGGGISMSALNITGGSISVSGTPPIVSTTDAGVPQFFLSAVMGGAGTGYTYSFTGTGTTYTTPAFGTDLTAGSYTEDLSVTDGAGETLTATASEVVHSDPIVSASSSVSSADVGYSITFSSSPSGGTGPYSYSWTLNGSQLSTAQDFSYSFASAGSYTLTITITDSVGVTYSATVSVTINDNPSVSVSSSQNATDVGNSVSFSAVESGGTGADTYSWLINGVQESTAASFSYSFSSAGSYYVNVTVTDGDGHTASYSYLETVNPDPSVVIHVVHNPTDVGTWANFTASISGGTGADTYSWTVNGGSFTTPYVNYTFTASGTFSVSLTITDANGNTASNSMNEVVNPDPLATIEAQYATVDQGINDTLFAQVTGGSSPFNYSWSLGSEIVNYSQEFHLQFPNTGSYTVNLSVTDSLGEKTTTSFTIKVIAKPSALIEGSNRTDISTTTYWEGFGSYGTAPYNYYWYLNGVNTSSGLYFQYSFPKTGPYNISLLIMDSQGSKAYAYLDITVEPLPLVTVSESRSTTDVGIPVYFNATTSGGTPFYNYTWSISGIGYVGYQQDMVYTFSLAGYYNVSVKVSDGSGNVAEASIEIRINALPGVSISVEYPNVDVNVIDAFNAVITGGTPGYSYSWFVNGSAAGDSPSLNYSFAKQGIYPVRLVVMDSQGQSSSYVLDVTVESYPVASIIPSRTSLDANVSDQFRASGSGGIGPYSYEWVIAGHTFHNGTVSYVFQAPGNYTVQLVISDSFGKDASASILISVYPDPQVSISWSGTPIVSRPFGMHANITGGMPPYATSWIFPSGQHESGTNVSHVFESSGPRTFEVQASDQGGYIQTKNFSISVDLYVAIAANQTSGLAPLAVQFTSSVLGGTGYSYNWSFGDGHYSLEQDPSYSFPVGNYTVAFTVTSANGATGYANISIQSLPPPVSFVYSSGLNITQAFVFRAEPNWDAQGPYNMSWSFPNGQTLTGLNISYKFPIYNELNTVIATFSYDNGKTWTQYLTVRMIPAAPTISFTSPREIPVDTMLSLNATATAPDSSTFSYSWDINGSSYSGQSVLYYFGHAGNYSISVTATDGLGASSTSTQYINVLPPGTNSSIVLSYRQHSVGPMTYYTIKVQSLHGITAVEAFIGSTMYSPTAINSTYSTSGEIGYFNLTMNQGQFDSGTYGIKVVVFNNNSASNSMTMPFSVSNSLSSNPFTLGTLISFFGGLSNFLIIMLTLAGIGIAAIQLRKPPIDVVATSGGKTKTYKLDTKR